MNVIHQKKKIMTAREFFYLVSNMRQAQNEYFRTRDPMVLRACKAIERDVDEEIARVKDIESRRQT